MQKVNSVLDFCSGAIVERINFELYKVFENIQNRNTDEKARKLTVEIELTPVNDRQNVRMKTQVKTRLSPTHPVETTVSFNNENGLLRAYEFNGIPDGQKDIFGDIHEQNYIEIKSEEE
ncbi:MAG: hypothetical protein U0H79_08385 [Eubacterium sp.]|mgnify:CR=1|nr:hypothetical protein [Eubacterium sp.]MEE0175782.1 hypothetical protein [Eubacterium sp.]